MELHDAGPSSRADGANRESDGTLLFDAVLELQRRDLTWANRTRALVRHPFLTLQIVAGIYWQALRLRLLGAPFYPHPRSRENHGVTS